MTGTAAQSATTFDSIRAEMPAFESRVWLNSGFFGAVPRRVTDAMARAAETEAALGGSSPDGWRHRNEIERQARLDAAWLVDAEPDEVALTSNTTEGMNAVVHGLSWRAGERLVITDLEHPAVVAPAIAATRRYGLELRTVELAAANSAQAIIDAFDRQITPGTRLVAFSEVCYTNGLRTPVAEIVRLAHDRGALVAVDGAQALGQVHVDAHALGVDFYAATGQKWLAGPPGTGLLFVRKDLVPELTPVWVSHHAFANVSRWGSAVDNTSEARRFEVSTMGPAVMAGFSAAVSVARDLGRDAIEQRCAGLASYAVGKLLAVPGVRFVSPREGALMSGLVCFRVGDYGADQVTATLWERARIVGGGREDRSGDPVEYEESTRLSTSWFNTEEDIDRAVEVVAGVAREGPVAIEGSDWAKTVFRG